MFDFDIMSFIAGLPGLILAMAVHEYAHARAAVALGDITPRMTGRLTLNPLAHIDPIGLLMLILAHFGWAKPVMINPRNFKNYKRDDILVSLAGPAANLLLAFLTLVVLLIYSKFFGRMSQGTYLVLQLIVLYNINFAIFNMIPLPPLDGSHILKHFLPARCAYRYAQIERYSFFILIAFVMTPVLTYILIPLQQLVWFIFCMILMPFFG